MTFYLNPPSGNISLHNLEKFARTRLDFLLKIYSCGGDKLKLQDTVTDFLIVKESDCLIDGSTKDVVSHFILRLILCQDKDTKEFLMKAESQLFTFRFQCMSEDELTKSLKRTDSHLKKAQYNEFIPSIHEFEKLQHIREIFKMITSTEQRWRSIVKKYLSGDNKEGFQIPFFIVPGLVAKRRVELENGLAFVPFCKLMDVISHLWYQLLVWGVDRACRVQTNFLQDKRIRVLTRNVQAMFRKRHGTFEGGPLKEAYLSHDHVSEVMTFYPPCMLHVHHLLTTRHRLQHHARIQYTLFLKEIGMPVHEALMFWRKEYSNPVESVNGCLHGWQQDSRRYTYNIRHLYGLEGACINYRGHCCKTLQNSTSGVGDQGGCPFKCFDTDHLHNLLQREEIHHSRETILKLSSEGKYSEACRCLFVEKTKRLAQKCEVQDREQPTATLSGFREDDVIMDKGHKVTDNTTSSQTFDHGASDIHIIKDDPEESIVYSYTNVKEMTHRHFHSDTNCNSCSDTVYTGTDSYETKTVSDAGVVKVDSLPVCTKSGKSCSTLQKNGDGIEDRPNQDNDIQKPSQYYFSLRRLVEGLKEFENKSIPKK